MAKKKCNKMSGVIPYTVSLVNRGANKKTFLEYKGEKEIPEGFEFKQFDSVGAVWAQKEDDERRLVTGVVYAPNEIDSHGDFMEAKDIEEMAHLFMKSYRAIDVNHNFIAGAGDPVESFIAPSDMVINGQNVTKGSWILTVNATQEMFDQIKAGDLNSFSFAGLVAKEEVEVETEESGMIEMIVNGCKKKIKKFVDGVFTKKDFNEVMRIRRENEIYSLLWDLHDSIANDVWNNDGTMNSGDELKSKILNDVEQFSAAVQKLTLTWKSASDNDVPPNNQEGDVSMTLEEMTKALNEALAPLTAKIEQLEEKSSKEPVVTDESKKEEPAPKAEDAVMKQLADAVKALGTRIEAIEKSMTDSNAAPKVGVEKTAPKTTAPRKVSWV